MVRFQAILSFEGLRFTAKWEAKRVVRVLGASEGERIRGTGKAFKSIPTLHDRRSRVKLRPQLARDEGWAPDENRIEA